MIQGAICIRCGEDAAELYLHGLPMGTAAVNPLFSDRLSVRSHEH